MTAKKPDADAAQSEEQLEIEKVEEKVKRMLDPAEPDPSDDDTGKVPGGKPDQEPGTAPEVNGDSDDIKLPTEIKIVSNDEDEHIVAVSKKQKSAEPDVNAAENPDESSSGPTDEPVPESSQDTGLAAEADKEEPVAAPAEINDEDDQPADEVTNKAVDDIIASESDALLEAEDQKRIQTSEQPKPSFMARIKRLPAAWWHNRLARRATFIVLLLGLVVAMIAPPSRYFMLNTFGVRSGASIQILDDSTQQPLKNVQVSLRGQTELTDSEGQAYFSELKLGRTELVIERRAFAAVRKQVTLGWGSNPLGDASLMPVGSQYMFRVSDFLSGKPLGKIEAVSSEASAYSDEEGLIKLTVDKTDDALLEVSLIGDGLRTEHLSIDPDDMAERVVQMVPARKHVFISKRSGKYDVYKIDVDGQNEELVVAGSGHERSDMVLVPHPDKEIVALASTRTGARNGQGFLMSTLLLVDLSDNSTVEVALSERVQVLGWLGDKLVYVRIIAGSSAANPSRHRLMTYDLETFESEELASSNYFNDLLLARNRIYYASSSAYQSGPVALFGVKADGSDRQTVVDKETWSLFRTAHHALTLAVGQDWYEYNLGNGQLTKLGGEPANLRDRAYADSPDGKQSLWIDIRDGKGVLLVYDVSGNKDTQVLEQSGLKTPIHWLNNNSVVYRVSTAEETADYALSLNGGEPKKIRDVTDTAGVDNWYYY